MKKMKMVRSKKKRTDKGGVIPVLYKIQEMGIPELIRDCLGERIAQAQFGYDDIFIAWVLTALCGGSRLEHISKMNQKLSIISDLKIPSHDTVGRELKKLATETRVSGKRSTNRSKKTSTTKVNDNIDLNRMLIMSTKKIGSLSENIFYTVDIDATFFPTKCYDSVRNGKKNRLGYNPMMCLIGDLPVYISMRSGNASAAFEIAKCMGDCLSILDENKIKVGKVISDGAGHNKQLMKLLDSKGIKYNIRMPFMKSNKGLIKGLLESEWAKEEIRTTNAIWECEISEFPYTMKDSKVKNRIVALRVPDYIKIAELESAEEGERRKMIEEKMEILDKGEKLKKLGKHSGGHGQWVNYKGYDYKLIITNDLDTSPKKLMLEYNKRGGAERKFDFIKNDFSCRLPPFMNMNENLVFAIAAALANNLYKGVLKIFNKIIPELKLTWRLPEFRFMFIDVACQIIKGNYDFGDVSMPYEKLN